jgi:hypothetical protein
MVQAFRVKIMQQEGYVSWTHLWANGIAVWKAYQFLPHILTVGLQSVLHTPIPQTMVIMTVILFTFLHASVYLTIRLLSFNPLTAVIASLLSMDLAQFWGGVGDYSLSFGFAIFPIMLFLWVKFYSGKMQYLFPYLAGISFYMHPLLGVCCALLMILGIVISDQKVLSLKTLLQIGILLATSVLFWFPVLIKTSFAYANPFFRDQYFLQQVVAGYKYFGLSLAILLCFPLALVGIFLHGKKELQWANVLFIFAIGFLFLFFLGINFPLPKFIAQFQFTRGVTFIGIAITYVVILLFDSIYKSSAKQLKIIATIVIIPIALEAVSSVQLYAPPTTDHMSDPVSAYTQQPLTDGKIWTNGIGGASYFSPLNYQFPYSYMGHMDSNIISPRISQFMIYGNYPGSVPAANLSRMNEYFKIAGVRYAFFDENSPFTQTLVNPQTNTVGMADLGILRSYDVLYHGFKTTFPLVQAEVVNPKLTEQLFTFPKNPSIADLSDVISVDADVKRFNKILYNKDNTFLPVTYPAQDKITLTIPKNPISNKVYLNESYDPEWHATINNEKVAIEPIGPNYMLLTLPKNTPGGTLNLQHVYPAYVIIGTLSIFFIGADILAAYIISKFKRREIYA